MAQLIDPKTEQALWAESYEQDLENVLLLWSEVAQAIAGEVQVALTPEDTKRFAGARPINPEAHDAYLKGSYHSQRLTPEDLDTAESYFELALEKDPSYAPAYAGLAGVWANRNQMGIAAPHEAGPKAKALALQAVALDDSSAIPHFWLAVVRTWTDWDWAGAEPEFRRALKLDPNFPNAAFAHLLAITGRIDEAIPHSERAIELDPFNALAHAFYAQVLYGARRYDDAIAAARTALAMQPSMPVAHSALEHAFFSNGMRDEQLAYQREQFASDPEHMAAFEQGLAEAGYEGAQRRIADLLAVRFEEYASGPVSRIAKYYLYAGDYDRAMDWLEKAFEVHDPNLPYVGFHPLWDVLRSDARFQDLLRRMSLPTTGASSDPDEQR
jgi:tetratricopeptide (TPR) repeat protein